METMMIISLIAAVLGICAFEEKNAWLRSLKDFLFFLQN